MSTEGAAEPPRIEQPRITFGAKGRDMRPQFDREREPLSALTDRGEIAMPLLFDGPPASFEGQELVVADARQALPRAPTGADLHAFVETDVVDDVDAGERKVGIGGVAVAPAACGTRPVTASADALHTSTEGAGAREGAFRRHGGRLRAPSDITTDAVARSSARVHEDLRAGAAAQRMDRVDDVLERRLLHPARRVVQAT